MNPPTPTSPFWSTASFGDTTDSLPMELSELGQHMDSCKTPFSAVQCIGEVVNRFITARFVTTLVVATFLIGGAALVA
jgi:hypothetical protein